MATQRLISLYDSARFKQSVVLDGVSYILVVSWNTRGEFWTLDIYDSDENLLRANLKLVLWYPLKAQYNDVLLPPGEFVLMDASTSTYNQDPGRHDFGTGRNLELWYITQ